MKDRSGLSSPSVLAAPNTVPILVWDECAFQSAAEVRICLSAEPAKPEVPSQRCTSSILALTAAVLTSVAIAAAVAVPMAFLHRTNDNAVQVQTAGSFESWVTIPLHIVVGLTVASKQHPTTLTWNSSACVGEASSGDLRSVMQNAFMTTLRVLGAPGLRTTINDIACNSTTTSASVIVEVPGADLAAGVERALKTPEAGEHLESALAEQLDLMDLVVNIVIDGTN
ncbi:hypothetical protein Vretimale_13745 [Volvox reticuliferus]|uniref:Uncharacterized protein n=1 Tax=Volvox reticuliferus TaxID=1737510 RepID=A0A8J4LU10_9CHLO|nr:hypothetical protein Vretifemale_14632 [Volvox reticuliferus]GIM09961.1 hypothetical protein Vretimale_13745 [Volvox reticuliferus]